MKRTTTRRRREIKNFLADNRRLFPFAGLFLGGVAIGVAVYVTARPAGAVLDGLLALTPVAGGVTGWLAALWGSCFSTLLLLAALYLLGLWACGAPFILLVPLFHGLGLGLTEAYYYAKGAPGVATVAALVMPVGLLSAAVLAMAGAESLRLSTRLSRQLLPGDTGEGGLWQGFRLYSLRFLLFILAALAVSGLDVLLRSMLAGRLL